jgi:hypothetical protein
MGLAVGKLAGVGALGLILPGVCDKLIIECIAMPPVGFGCAKAKNEGRRIFLWRITTTKFPAAYVPKSL